MFNLCLFASLLSILHGLRNLLLADSSNLPMQVASKLFSNLLRTTFLSSTSMQRNVTQAPAETARADQETFQALYLLMTCDFVPAPAQLLGKFHVLLLQGCKLLGLLSRCQLQRFTARTESGSLP